MGAAAAPWIMSAVGSLASSRGAKKAAKQGGEPQVPSIFMPALSEAAARLFSNMRYGAQTYGGQMTAGQTGLQRQSLNQIQRLLGQGEAGLNDAMQTIMAASQQGLSPADIDLARQQTNPLYEYQRSRALGGLREAQAQGGRYFSMGAANQEANLLGQMEANYSSQIFDLAQQMQRTRLEAAMGLPDFLMRQLGAPQLGFNVGEQSRQIAQQGLTAQMQEWLRTRPENSISMLAGLMGGTPFYNPTVGPNAWSTIGGMLSDTAASEGFQKWINDTFGTP